MSHIARIVLACVPYHITQRGNGRQQVFFEGTDCRLHLDLLRRNAATAGLTIWA
jgi:putative transposase